MQAVTHRDGPSVVVIYDRDHQDPKEQELTRRVESISPQDKIACVLESMVRDRPALEQYSLELLHENDTYSTASALQMTVAHTLVGSGFPQYVAHLLGLLYTDAYFRKIFDGAYYQKYSPVKYNLSKDFPKIDWKDPAFTNTIANIDGLFKMLDRELPKLGEGERDEFMQQHLWSCAFTICQGGVLTRSGFVQMSHQVLGVISEAAAVYKIAQIEKAKGAAFDRENECSLQTIKNLFYNDDEEASGRLLSKLNNEMRTQFQLQKIELIYKRIAESKADSQDWTLLVRVGMGHQETMTAGLKHRFGDAFRELTLDLGALPPADQLARVVKSSTAEVKY